MLFTKDAVNRDIVTDLVSDRGDPPHVEVNSYMFIKQK